MKKTTQLKSACAALLMILCLGFNSGLKAQPGPLCPSGPGYRIVNTGPNTVVVAWEAFGPGCGVVAIGSGIVIPPFSPPVIIPWSTIAGAIDIYVTVGLVNGEVTSPNRPTNGVFQPCNSYLTNQIVGGSTNGPVFYSWNNYHSCNVTIIN